MERVKISQLASANIEENDLIPFVKVPLNGLKTNNKTTFNDFKNSINVGNTQFTNIIQTNALGNEWINITEDLTTLIRIGDPTFILNTGYSADVVNNTSTALMYEYTQSIIVQTSIHPLAFEPYNTHGMLSTNYDIHTILNDGAEKIITINKMRDTFFAIDGNRINHTARKQIMLQSSFILNAGQSVSIYNKVTVSNLDFYTPSLTPNSLSPYIFSILLYETPETEMTTFNTKIFK